MSNAHAGPVPDPVRPEIQYALPPLPAQAAEALLPWHERQWQHASLRKLIFLALLAGLWDLGARYSVYDLLLPGAVQTAQAFVQGIASGELPARAWQSLRVLVQGYAAGVALAFVLTTLAVSTRFGRDLLSTLTAMFNPLPAIALLPLALLWFGLGEGSLVFELIHSVLWALALNMYAGFLGVSETLRMAGRNYGLGGLRYVLQILVPAALPAILAGAADRLGVRLAHPDRGGAGVRRLQRQGRPGLVHLPEPQRVIHRSCVRGSGGRGDHWPACGKPGVRHRGAFHGQALGHAALTPGAAA